MVQFSAPDPITSIINVTKILQDGTIEPLGQIFPCFDNESDSVNYVSIDNFGQEIFPPTSAFIDIENRFQKLINHNTEKSSAEDIEVILEEFENRRKTIKDLRKFKFRKSMKLITR